MGTGRQRGRLGECPRGASLVLPRPSKGLDMPVVYSEMRAARQALTHCALFLPWDHRGDSRGWLGFEAEAALPLCLASQQ